MGEHNHAGWDKHERNFTKQFFFKGKYQLEKSES